MALFTDRFIFYRWYWEAIRQLEDEAEQLELIKAVCNYGFYGLEHTFNKPYLTGMFIMIKQNIDRERKWALNQ